MEYRTSSLVPVFVVVARSVWDVDSHRGCWRVRFRRAHCVRYRRRGVWRDGGREFMAAVINCFGIATGLMNSGLGGLGDRRPSCSGEISKLANKSIGYYCRPCLSCLHMTRTLNRHVTSLLPNTPPYMTRKKMKMEMEF